MFNGFSIVAVIEFKKSKRKTTATFKATSKTLVQELNTDVSLSK